MLKKLSTDRLLLVFAAAAVIHSATAATDNLYPLTVIHINDFHVRFDEISAFGVTCKPEAGQECIGGYARNVQTIRELQASASNPVFVNAGDNFFGTLFWDLFKWEATTQLLNLLPADAMTLGNHEFDDGISGIVPYLDNIKTPILVANIDDSEEPTFQGKYEKSLIIEKGGRKIGIIGVTTVELPGLSYPEQLKFLDEVASVRSEASNLRQQGANIIVVLSHCGLPADKKIATEAGPDIDIIVGGHTHDLLYTGKPPGGEFARDVYPLVVTQSGGHKVLIVQAGAFSKFVGNLTVYFDEAGEAQAWEGNPIYLDGSIAKAQDIEAAILPWKKIVDEKGAEVMGSSRVPLGRETCNVAECNYGNLITEAYVNYYINLAEPGAWTKSAVAITNAGIIRNGLPAGNITYKDLTESHPYDNRADTFDLQGKYLLEALEKGAENYGTVNFLQMSGVRLVLNVTQPVGKRVVSVRIRCNECEVPHYEELDLEKDYRVIVTSWVGDGMNGFDVFREHRKNWSQGPDSFGVLKDYVAKRSPILSLIDGKIRVLR